ncbi:WD domain, G-beta repeat containing protein [Babesia caballi]|uniref:WD domain, G-beta repeat containing protein n=1 Tax=Babesia caballi TaxID=5871 RepID=A0AAV4M0U1_BABCB|nr:WD domain, G-beta repeat containing protein [Babesia caballi]
MNVISCLKWLPKSYTYADFFQSYIHRTDEDASELDLDEEEEVQRDEITDEFDLDNYDGDDIPGSVAAVIHMETIDEKLIIEDPEDVESRKLDQDDRVIVCGNSGEDCASIDFFIYNTAYCGLETCHSILVAAFLLALEVVPNLPNYAPLVAAGTYESQIDLWDMRQIDRLDPVMTLGSKKKSQKESHKDAVQCLSNSAHVVQLMASGSADKTVKVWDLNEAEVLHSLNHHSSNVRIGGACFKRVQVQVVQFSPFDASLLLTASFDQTAALCDIRVCKGKTSVTLDSEVESAVWKDVNNIVISMENGSVVQYDIRNEKKLWQLQAHKKACSSVQLVDDIMVTCGLDSKAKVYKITGGTPTKLASKDLNSGPLFNVTGSPDDKHLMGFGGEQLVLWDLDTIENLDSML